MSAPYEFNSAGLDADQNREGMRLLDLNCRYRWACEELREERAREALRRIEAEDRLEELGEVAAALFDDLCEAENRTSDVVRDRVRPARS